MKEFDMIAIMVAVGLLTWINKNMVPRLPLLKKRNWVVPVSMFGSPKEDYGTELK